MSGLIAGLLFSLIPACQLTPREGVANGAQSLRANDVLADHHGGVEKNGFKIPESIATPGQLRDLNWVFTSATFYPLIGLDGGKTALTSLTTEDLTRTQDPYFCAMRWNYGPRPEAGMTFFANRRLLLVTLGQKTRAVVARVVDWGPPMSSEGGIMLSQATFSALGISPGTTIGVAFEENDSEETGPLVLGAQ